MSLSNQLKRIFPILVVAYVPTFLLLSSIVVLAQITNKRVWFFTSDPFVLGHLPFYAGIISTIGILLWCATTAICFFSSFLAGFEGKRVWGLFLLCSGILTSILLFDDLFQMHRIFYPKFFHLATICVYGTYGLFVFWYFIHFQKQIRETEFLLLTFSLIFFVLAVAVDTVHFVSRGSTALSDGWKLFGIVTWFTYFTRTCWKVVCFSFGQGGPTKGE